MMRASIAVSQRAKDAMGIKNGVDPMPERRVLLQYIKDHEPIKAHEMIGAGVGFTHRLVWLQKEGYVDCVRVGTRGALWSITPLGKRWIAPTRGELVPPRTIAFTGCATESRDVVWPDVRGGSMRAFELQSRGME